MLRFRFSKGVPIIAFAFLAAVETAQAQVCVRVDETLDTLSPADRKAAVLLLERQFELAGKSVVHDCQTPYQISHIRLGNVITVTLSGSEGRRDATAQGLNDLPALYSQLVRSLVTGRDVVDRSNVTVAQTSASRVHSDSLTYVQLGYGSSFGNGIHGMPAVGFGHRAELDSFAIDVSLNTKVGNYSAGSSGGAGAGAFIKLEGLHFIRSRSSAAPYFGGGISWGGNASNNYGRLYYGTSSQSGYSTGWHGSGIHGELTTGYEFARATTIRVFVQADATLPFYKVTSETYSGTSVVATNRSYAPSVAFTIGLGWQKNRR